MLKKALSVSAICAMFSGVSFAKPGAIDIANLSLQGIEEAGITYSCHGDSSYAVCKFQDIDTFAMQLKDLKVEFFLSRSTWKQITSAEIKTYLDLTSETQGNVDIFMPKRLLCTSEANLDSIDFQKFGKETCSIKTDVATINFDVNTITDSKTFRYKTMPTILTTMLHTVRGFADRYARLDSEYYENLAHLREGGDQALKELTEEQEALREALKRYEYKAESSCGCDAQENYTMANEIKNAIMQNDHKRTQIQDKHLLDSNILLEEYEKNNKKVLDDIVAWAKQYNLNITEIRFNIQAKKLAETTFNIFMNNALNESIMMFGEWDINYAEDGSLSQEQQLALEQERKEAYGSYYGSLEGASVAASMFIKQNPYLQDHLKKSLVKAISDHAKLFDPNSHRRSVKVLIKPINNYTMNIGEEFEKFRNAYAQDKQNRQAQRLDKRFDAVSQVFFNIINQYDIKSVRYWPNYQN